MRCILRWTVAGAAIVLSWRPAGAVDVAALYEAYWAGMPAGEIRLVLHDDNGAYRDQIEIRTDGLPHLLTRFRGGAISEGRLAASLPAPDRYEARYALRKGRDKRLVMRFAGAGGVVVAVRGPGDTSKKPPLPARFRTNVLDPLSALSAIRDRMRRGDPGPFSLPVYDGARRFDVAVRVLPKAAGERQMRLQLSLLPVAGFSGDASDDGDPDDAPRPAILTMTDDGRSLPLAMRVSLAYMPLDIRLKARCEDVDICR